MVPFICRKSERGIRREMIRKRNSAVHHPRSLYHFGLQQLMPTLWLAVLAMGVPDLAMAQASPFMTGATALQTYAQVFDEEGACQMPRVAQMLDMIAGEVISFVQTARGG